MDNIDTNAYTSRKGIVSSNKIFYISDKVQIFNPQTNQWTIGKSPPAFIYQGAAVATTETASKQIYVFGGGRGSNLTEIYNVSSDSWSDGVVMPIAQN